jgi:uncharacterized protein YkwD
MRRLPFLRSPPPPVVSESGAPASAPAAQIVVSPATNDLPVTALGFDIWGDPSQAPGTAYVAPASAPAPAAPSEAAPAAPAQPAPAVAAPQASAPVAPKPVVQQPAPAAAPAQASKPNFYLPEPVTGPATPLEQRLLDDINAERAKAGLPAYTYDAGLTKIARMRSRQLVDQNYFGHVDPYGYSMYTELLAYFGYSYAWAGENLAMNNSPVERSPEVATNGLMNSPTHRANLLANDFFRIGIGEVTTADGRHFYTMIFLG